MRGALAMAVLCGLVGGGAPAGRQAASSRDADALEQKLARLVERGAAVASGPSAAPLRTPVSDREVNAYFQFQGQEHLPVGVREPRLVIVDALRIEARALVDLDAVRASRERLWTDPLSWVGGVIEVRAAGKLRTANGHGTLELESASLGGAPMPKAFLQALVSHYSKTPESPEGFNLDRPFALPHQIRHVELQRGSAIIVQ